MGFKFTCVPIDISKELNDAIIDAKSEAKKNGHILSNKDIMSKALNLLFSLAEVKIEQNNVDIEPITITPETQVILPNNEESPLFDYKSLGYLTNIEAAKFIGCTVAEICKAHKEGQMKFKRTGRLIRQHIDDLKAWNEQRLKKMFA